MEANVFIARLKADTVEKYKCKLDKVLDEYKLILDKLPAKDRGLFSLNVLRTLCWNIDKAPIWKENVDNSTLLTLAKECTRGTHMLGKEDQVKTLACIYHLHKHAVRLNKPVPPELVLALSITPFFVDSKHLLKDYHKTYWQILADRLTYIERLQSKFNITKHLPKLTADIIKLIEIYDTVPFCSTIIVYLFKKLHMLYSTIDASKLTQPFKQIFSALCKKDDLAKLEELSENEMLDIYTKLNDCLYVVADNSSKLQFKDGTLNDIVHNCVVLVNHRKDLFFCLQTFYVTLFCKIVSYETSISYVETLFGSLEETIQNGNKLGYENALLTTYPYLNQLLHLYIEYNITNGKPLSEIIQASCLKLILFFTRKQHCNQIIKCENCPKKSSLHDAFRLSLQTKHLIQHGQKEALDTFYQITTEQYVILTKLEKLGCTNYQRYFRKLQTDVHNTAITLNKSKLYSTSIKLFDIYLKNELNSKEIDHKNISRALFNRSICELDSKLYEKAIINAFLSLTFAQQDGLSSDKYMSLVMDIKARELKAKDDDDKEIDADRLQLVTVLDACKMALDSQLYGDLEPFLKELKLSSLLRCEFSAYARLWPSAAPVAGVWRALHALARSEHDDWKTVENEAAISEVLYDVVLETPSVVRSIHNPHFSTIVGELLDDFDNMTTLTPDEKLVHATLLFLQCEYDLAGASQKYKWKVTEPSPNPDSQPATRTFPQEHAATRRAILAVRLLRDLLRDLLPGLTQAPPRVSRALAVLQVFVPQLQLLSRPAAALQLAHCCCLMADVLGNRECYLRNAGVLLAWSRRGPALDDMLARAARWREGWEETDLVFLCDVATYYKSQGKPGAAAQLVQAVRTRILHALETQPGLNLDLAVGRVLELQCWLRGEPGAGLSALAAAGGAFRHYLGLGGTGWTWSSRRVRSLSVRVRRSLAALGGAALPAALGRRARARAAAAALPAESAAGRARLHTHILDITNLDAAQIIIDQHLKEILGLQPSNETQPSCVSDTQKQPIFTPRQELETMRDNMVLRNQTSPCDIINSVPAFKVPDFFHHHTKCTCYACEIPVCLLLACKTSSIEAAMYAFANENEIARNYFQGVSNMFDIAEKRLKKIRKMYMEVYDDFIVESVLNSYEMDFKTIKVKLLIDLAMFELKNNEFDAADETVIEINEIVQEIDDLDQYLKNDVLNLMVASVQLKKGSKKRDLLSEELENLHISPAKETIEPPSTPVTKPSKPPKTATKKIVEKEELPQKRILHLGCVKLDLNSDESEFEEPKRLTRGVKKDKFKIPKPIVLKPTLEEATPRPSRSRPRIILTEPSVDMATPTQANKENIQLFTPKQSTPEQFFTPMTSVKTYSKKSLRQNIVKNLEEEFSTPMSVRKEEKNETLTSGKRERSSDKEDSILKQDTLKLKEAKQVAKEEKLTVKEVKSKVKENLKVIEQKDGNATAKGRITKTSSVKDTLSVAGSSRSRKEEKKTLMRAVSPGKMNKEEKNARSRRQ